MPDVTSTGKAQYYTAATLDGFIADPEHSLDWLFQFGETGTDDFPASIGAVGAGKPPLLRAITTPPLRLVWYEVPRPTEDGVRPKDPV